MRNIEVDYAILVVLNFRYKRTQGYLIIIEWLVNNIEYVSNMKMDCFCITHESKSLDIGSFLLKYLV